MEGEKLDRRRGGNGEKQAADGRGKTEDGSEIKYHEQQNQKCQRFSRLQKGF